MTGHCDEDSRLQAVRGNDNVRFVRELPGVREALHSGCLVPVRVNPTRQSGLGRHFRLLRTTSTSTIYSQHAHKYEVILLKFKFKSRRLKNVQPTSMIVETPNTPYVVQQQLDLRKAHREASDGDGICSMLLSLHLRGL